MTNFEKQTHCSDSLLSFDSVTTCCLARHALNLLRERKDGYDIVISDVNMPDMDGFKLLEHVGLEMDLPVISQFSLNNIISFSLYDIISL